MSDDWHMKFHAVLDWLDEEAARVQKEMALLHALNDLHANLIKALTKEPVHWDRCDPSPGQDRGATPAARLDTGRG
jgi:hypothetical protein